MKKTTLTLSDKVKIDSFNTGPDHTFPGLRINDGNGEEIDLVLAHPTAVFALYEALGLLFAGQMARMRKLTDIMHGEVGCEKTHKILAQSINEITEDAPKEKNPFEELFSNLARKIDKTH